MLMNKREVWIDWLRVAACFMVFVVHATEPFYLGGEGSRILTESDAFWSSFFDSFVEYNNNYPGYPGYYVMEGNIMFGAKVVEQDAIIKLVDEISA